MNFISSCLPLKKNDVVEIVAPSSGISSLSMSKILSFVKEFGLNPFLHPSWQQEHHPLYAADDLLRFESLKNALMSQSKLIWIARGGEGMARLIPLLEAWSKTLSKPLPYKLVIGFSDATALHLFLNQKWGWPTLHGPTLSCMIKGHLEDHSLQSLKKVLFEPFIKVWEENLSPMNSAAQQEQTIRGPLLGGNHSLIHCSIGTSWQCQGKDRILFFEDINEKGYRTDLRFQHLLQANILQDVKAILLSDFSLSDSRNKTEIFKINYALQNFADALKIPVFKMPGYGHTSQNKPLFLGVTVSLKTGKNPRLEITL